MHASVIDTIHIIVVLTMKESVPLSLDADAYAHRNTSINKVHTKETNTHYNLADFRILSRIRLDF